MEYRTLGRSGLQVSVIGLGGMNFGWFSDERQSREVIAAAADSGINTIDTADIYGEGGSSESIIGEAIAGQRDRWVIMTKYALPTGDGPNRSGASRRYIREAVQASLRRLRTDYIDVYQAHRFDPHTPIEETMAALHDLVREGLVRYIGCSNYSAWQVAESNAVACEYGWTPLVSSQPRYNVIDRGIEVEHIPACVKAGLGLVPWSPLAGGFLTGKHRRGKEPLAGTRMQRAQFPRAVMRDRNWDRLERLEAIATERGLTMTDLAIGWLVAQPTVSTIIAGASTPEQLRENVAAAEVRLDEPDLAAIDEASR